MAAGVGCQGTTAAGSTSMRLRIDPARPHGGNTLY